MEPIIGADKKQRIVLKQYPIYTVRQINDLGAGGGLARVVSSTSSPAAPCRAS